MYNGQQVSFLYFQKIDDKYPKEMAQNNDNAILDSYEQIKILIT